jgi:hypothetical protein
VPNSTKQAKPKQTNTTLLAALEYYSRNWGVIPISAKTKKPALRSWEEFKTERANEDLIRQWFADGKKRLGLMLGPVSGGLVVRDFDTVEAYFAWVAKYQAWRKLPTVQTGRGYHVYGRLDFPLFQSAVGENCYFPFDDGEMRFQGCYVLAPPSVHESGTSYKWIVPPPVLGESIPFIDPWKIGWVPKHEPKSVYIETHAPEKTQATQDTHAPQDIRESVSVVENPSSSSPPNPPPPPPKSASFVHESISPDVRNKIENAVRETLPNGIGQRHKMVFELARALKAIPELASSDPLTLRPIVTSWHRLAEKHTQTTFAETWTDFLNAWDNVKYPKGEEPMTVASEHAKRGPYPDAITDWADGPTFHLAGLCRELQRFHGSEPFYLSCHVAGKQIGVSHTHANKILKSFRRYGVLRIVEAGKQGAGQDATTWRYLGPM